MGRAADSAWGEMEWGDSVSIPSSGISQLTELDSVTPLSELYFPLWNRDKLHGCIEFDWPLLAYSQHGKWSIITVLLSLKYISLEKYMFFPSPAVWMMPVFWAQGVNWKSSPPPVFSASFWAPFKYTLESCSSTFENAIEKDIFHFIKLWLNISVHLFS